jgi:hypothetical protein
VRGGQSAPSDTYRLVSSSGTILTVILVGPAVARAGLGAHNKRMAGVARSAHNALHAFDLPMIGQVH